MFAASRKKITTTTESDILMVQAALGAMMVLSSETHPSGCLQTTTLSKFWANKR